MTIRPLWHEAAAFSAHAHRHQIRKDGRTPYASHPARVAMILATIFGCEDETVLADLEIVEKRVHRLTKDRSDPQLLKTLERVLEHLVDNAARYAGCWTTLGVLELQILRIAVSRLHAQERVIGRLLNEAESTPRAPRRGTAGENEV